MKKKLLVILVIVAIAVLVVFLPKKTHPYANSDITSEIFETENGFGYKIFIEGNLFIDQSTIPAVSGNISFKSKSDAEITADLAIEKIRKGEIPPTINTKELESLGVIWSG